MLVIEKYLEDLDRRIDSAVEEELFEQWRAFADGRVTEGIFSPKRPGPSPPGVEWPHVLVNDALTDFEAMALQQLEQCSKALAEGSGALLAVRCNFGTAILPSLFGAELFLMDREIDTLPACRPLPGGAEAIKPLLDAGIPDLNAGQGGATFRMGEHLNQLLRDYPKLSQYVHLYHPDLQGPMNVCEMLWGSSLYVDLYDKPDLVRDFLSLITETYIRFMRRWDECGSSNVTRLRGPGPEGRCASGRRTAASDGASDAPRSAHPMRASQSQPLADQSYAVHWSMLHRGRIMVRDDAATNLSPAMYEQIVRPYDQRLLAELGGGGIHFCGRGDHLIAKIGEISGVHAINTTQPGLNNIETIFRHTIDQQINLIGFERQLAEQAVQQGRPLHGRVHCW